ncbi:hypothetical protein H6P81_002349 [Aristolochia fimbriata]|uniref:Uncharacterized protein n=1 Tax=Aristolochia fimbriata TaxID=158543 RepID=A0AAV7FCR2_ARIFI|nr:hypothetical protein H6P81_002349 [Aristolochia fimbriata]
MSSCRHNKNVPIEHEGHPNNHLSDVSKDLVLRIAGKEVAFASRVPSKRCYKGFENQNSLDHINIFLSSGEDQSDVRMKLLSGSTVSRILLGTITGLGTSPQEASCDVYSNCGTKTHVIMKHRTLMVKHMHRYTIVDKTSPCECRCSRAQLPPSKFWLFDNDVETDDIGGWYVEKFGRDNEGCIVSSGRRGVLSCQLNP